MPQAKDEASAVDNRHTGKGVVQFVQLSVEDVQQAGKTGNDMIYTQHKCVIGSFPIQQKDPRSGQ
jgi:hypothetical protein